MKKKTTYLPSPAPSPSTLTSPTSSGRTLSAPVVSMDLSVARRASRLVIAIEILAEASKGHADAIKSLAEAARILSVLEGTPIEVQEIGLDQASTFVRRAMHAAPRATRRRTPSPAITPDA